MADPVRKIIDLEQLRRKFRSRKPSASTAIDVDGQVLRVVQISGNAISRVFAQPLDVRPEADLSDAATLGSAIAVTLARMGLRPGPVAMGVPRHLVVLRTLSLPAVEDERELASMVHFQIAKDLPFRLDEAVVDFSIRRLAQTETAHTNGKSLDLGKKSESEGGDRLEVLVTAVKREVVEFYEQVAEAAGLKMASLGWLSYANARTLAACHIAELNEGVALVSLRPDEASVEILSGESLLFSRGAPIKFHPKAPDAAAEPQPATDAPDTQSSEPENFVDAATIEVVRSLHSYGGMEPHVNVAKIIVAGATGHESAVVETLGKRISIPCSLLDPVSALHLPEEAREHASGSISAIGLALSATDPEGLPFDFLHPKKPPIQRNMRRIRVLASAAAAAAALIFFFGARKHFIDERLKVQRAVQAELSKEEKNRPLYRRMRLQASAAKEWAAEGQNWLEHYAYLSSILPPSEEIYITSLSVSGPGTIRFAVQARNGETLAKLDKQLRAVGYNVKPLAITPAADKHGYNFRSNVELTFTNGMKIDLAKVNTPARPADDASLDPAVRRGGGGQ